MTVPLPEQAPPRHRLEPPGIGDPAQLLELLASAAAKRRAVTSRHDHQTRRVERRPGDVPGADQSCVTAGKRQA
ncbi:MAG: hypothetical protein ABR972_09415 [Acidimicrobiales bacterium]